MTGKLFPKPGRTGSFLLAAALVAAAALAAPPEPSPPQRSPAPQAPKAIDWLDGSLTGDRVDLLWMPVPDAVRYRVFMEGARVGEVEDYIYSLAAPAAPGSYTFEVAALDAAGAEGPRSPAAEVRVAVFPSPPTHFVIRPELFGPKVRLRWGGVLGASSYHLYRGVGKEGPLVTLSAVDGCTFIDTHVKYTRRYRYAVAPLDAEGREGRRSEPVMVTTPTPGPC